MAVLEAQKIPAHLLFIHAGGGLEVEAEAADHQAEEVEVADHLEGEGEVEAADHLDQHQEGGEGRMMTGSLETPCASV